MIHFRMPKDHTRRNFLQTAPIAAAIGFPLTGTFLVTSEISAEDVRRPVQEPFQVFTAQKLADAMKTLQVMPGNDSLFSAKALPLTIVLTTEEKKSAKEFEYHEGRDHIFQILEGTTSYQLGGTPTNPRNTKPGEWLATMSEGATSITLQRGDMLVIPRGTPHKRSTETSVTFILISAEGTAKSQPLP